jgi:hypothetical protein
MLSNMKTTVQIPDTLFEEARKMAQQEKTTLKALMEQGLRKVLDERKNAKRFRLRRASFKGTGLQSDFRGASWEKIQQKSYEGRGA